jgi:hypothetical protein
MTLAIKTALTVSMLALSLNAAGAFTPVPIPEGKRGAVSFTPVPIPGERHVLPTALHPFNAGGFHAPRGGR